jgi:futalosine hydrolase
MEPGILKHDGRVLLAVAAEAEARAVMVGLGSNDARIEPWRLMTAGERFDVVLTGVGKANAAGAVARLAEPSRHAGVLSVGVGGLLPGSGLNIGAIVAANKCVFADEGIQTPDGFRDIAAMGFAPGPYKGSAVPVDGNWLDDLSALVDAIGPIATVSTCSGTDALARAVADRTGAIVEAMEGAAVAHAAAMLTLRAGELRVVSNTTGDRTHQHWALEDALSRLTMVIGRL